MVIEIKVDHLDWQIFNYSVNDVIGYYDSFKSALEAYGYDYNRIKSWWRKKGILSVEKNQFVYIDEQNNIGAIKFGYLLYIDLSYDNNKFYFYPNIKNIIEVLNRDEKIKTITNI